MIVLVRGVGDIGSAVAHYLFRDGYGVVIHDDPKPTTTRRGMAFADAVFDGQTTLDGVRAVLADDLEHVRQALAQREAIPVYVRPWGPLIATLGHRVLVDARMRKPAAAEVQIGYADLTVGLGPALVAGYHAHVLVETSWDDLGTVLTKGASLPLAGEPREIAGHARDRYVYAPVEGIFRTKARIGDNVRQRQEVAEIGAPVLTAPLAGVLRGLTHDDVLRHGRDEGHRGGPPRKGLGSARDRREAPANREGRLVRDQGLRFGPCSARVTGRHRSESVSTTPSAGRQLRRTPALTPSRRPTPHR